MSFFLIKLIPGDPVRALLGPRASQESIDFYREQLGLNESLITQYVIYLGRLVRGDFGESIVFRGPVSELILDRTGPTLTLVIVTTLIATAISLVLAAIAARRAGDWTDRSIRISATIGLGVPQFWLGVILIIVFSINFDLFPVAGLGDGGWDSLSHLVLPCTTLAIPLIAILVRNLRASYLEGLGSEYAVFARSKGASESAVFWRHVFRNSVVPTLQLLGVNVGWLLGGTVVVENVFAIPGLGELLVNAIFARDYFVIQAVTIVFAISVVFVSLVIDVLTVLIDPRFGQ